MLELLDLQKPLLPTTPTPPLIDIRVHDIQIDVEPSEFLLLPKIHIHADVEIRFPW